MLGEKSNEITVWHKIQCYDGSVHWMYKTGGLFTREERLHSSFNIIILFFKLFSKRCWVRRKPSYGHPFYSIVYVPGVNFQQTHVGRQCVPQGLQSVDTSRPIHHQSHTCLHTIGIAITSNMSMPPPASFCHLRWWWNLSLTLLGYQFFFFCVCHSRNDSLIQIVVMVRSTLCAVVSLSIPLMSEHRCNECHRICFVIQRLQPNTTVPNSVITMSGIHCRKASTLCHQSITNLVRAGPPNIPSHQSKISWPFRNFLFRNQNVCEETIFFFRNQYSTTVHNWLSTSPLTVRVIN